MKVKGKEIGNLGSLYDQQQEKIDQMIEKTPPQEYENVLENNDIKTMYALSEIRENIVNWYPIPKEASILQIGAGVGEITGALCKKAKKVVAYVTSNEEKVAVEKRHAGHQNLEVRVLQDVSLETKTEEKFDYVTLLGVLDMYVEALPYLAEKKLDFLIAFAKEKLKPQGTLLMALDNSLGMNYWTSVYTNSNIIGNKKNTLSRNQIETLLTKQQFQSYKFYYPLPDYKLTNVIYTDRYLPNLENISRDLVYADKEFVSFNTREGYQEVLKEDPSMFPYFANSYFIEASMQQEMVDQIQFVSFTNIRKAKYRIKTVIYPDHVEKTAVNEKAKQHILKIENNIDIMKNNHINTLDSYQEDTIHSRYITDCHSYDEVLIDILQTKGKQAFLQKVEAYKTYLIENLEQGSSENTVFDTLQIPYTKQDNIQSLHFVKHGLWDLVFQNAFYIDQTMYFYDQEWYYENVPVEFIIYRAIIYFRNLSQYVEGKEILEALQLTNYIPLFEKLDDAIQFEIRDDLIWNYHLGIQTGQTLHDLYKNKIIEVKRNETTIQDLNHQVGTLQGQLRQTKEQYENAKNEANDLRKQVVDMLNSTSWKLTKPVRYFGKYIRK